VRRDERGLAEVRLPQLLRLVERATEHGGDRRPERASLADVDEQAPELRLAVGVGVGLPRRFVVDRDVRRERVAEECLERRPCELEPLDGSEAGS